MSKVKNYVNEKIDTAKDYGQRIGDSALHTIGGMGVGGVTGAIFGAGSYLLYPSNFLHQIDPHLCGASIAVNAAVGTIIGLTTGALIYANKSKEDNKGDKI